MFLGLLPLLLVAGGLSLYALRHVQGAAESTAPPGERSSVGRRVVAALVAAAGVGILVAALGSTETAILVAGAVIGVALLLPAYRWLTPRGTLLLAIGVPAAVLLRGVMTFAFFSGDAYIPLLLQTWRGTPATLTGIVFTVTTLSWTAASWLQARRIDRYGPRRFVALGFALIALGALVTIPAVLPGVPPEVTILTWILPGLGMGFMYSAVTLVVLRGVGAGGAGERLVRAPAVGHPGDGAGHRHRRGDHRRGRRGPGPTGSGSRSRPCSRCRCSRPSAGSPAAVGWATSGRVRPCWAPRRLR